MRTQAIIFALILFCVLDALFIYLNSKIFSNQIIDVQRVVMIPKNLGVVGVYIILLFAFYYFVLRTRRPVYEAALLGAVINGVYELTNYSLFKKWKLSTVALDTLWGATLWGLTAYITYEFF
jgi:uncharacterized membrane protein